MSEDTYIPMGRLRVHGGGIIRFAIKAGELYAFIDPVCLDDKGVIILKRHPEIQGFGSFPTLDGGPDAKHEGSAGEPLP